MSGKKFDEGKPDLSLLLDFGDANIEVTRILELGLQKYGRKNWQEGFPPERLIAGVQRHLLEYWSGNPLDQESGRSHLAHAICGLYFLLWQDLQAGKIADTTECGECGDVKTEPRWCSCEN